MAGTRLDPRLSFGQQRHFFFHLSSKKLGKSLVPRADLDLDLQRIKYEDLWRETCVCARSSPDYACTNQHSLTNHLQDAEICKARELVSSQSLSRTERVPMVYTLRGDMHGDIILSAHANVMSSQKFIKN